MIFAQAFNMRQHSSRSSLSLMKSAALLSPTQYPMCWVVTWDALMQLLLLHVRFTAEKKGMLEEVILYIVSAIGLT